ncbi:MAG: aminoacyl-tRNA hydrolase [Patescibacteria group bacterium]
MKKNSQFIIVGLGNPGAEYEKTRHNTGRIFVDAFRKNHDFPDWEKDQKLNALVSEGKIEKAKVTLLLPETMMNNSGKAVPATKNLMVIYDELDLPLGLAKISFNRGSGGHRGLESIIKMLKTREFARMRIGIGKKKKVPAERVVDFILGKFTPAELAVLKKEEKKVIAALELWLARGLAPAMTEFNS